jgi:hypothetical protein
MRGGESDAHKRDELFTQTSRPAAVANELYAAHRILNESYEYFARVGGKYRTRTPAERERVALEKRLFDPKSKQLLLFLLRLDKKRRVRREQRRAKKSGGNVPPPSPSHATTAAVQEERGLHTGSEVKETVEDQSSHLAYLPAGFSTDVNVIRPLFSAAELADAEWWDPHNRDALRMDFLKQYALTQGAYRTL